MRYLQRQGDIVIVRSLPLVSYELELYGVADVVEFHLTSDARKEPRSLGGKSRWLPIPVEYKRPSERATRTSSAVRTVYVS